MEASAAGALFLARAREVRPGLDLDEATATDVAILLEHLDGLPLAIELAAARTRAASPGEILQRLESRGVDAIEGGAGDEHRSLGVILDWTLLQLPQRDIAVLQAVAVCAGFDLEFVDALVPGGRGVETIEALLALGLVRRAGTIGGVSRFRLLETIRTTVLRQMDADRLTEARRRHADHVVDLAGRWEQAAEGTLLREIAPWFDADADNVRRALDWLGSADPRRALELLSKLVPFWKLHARAAEGFARFKAAEAASPSLVWSGQGLRRASSRMPGSSCPPPSSARCCVRRSSWRGRSMIERPSSRRCARRPFSPTRKATCTRYGVLPRSCKPCR